ncbi:MAG: glutathione peroxidase [Pseudomonadota bacterium]
MWRALLLFMMLTPVSHADTFRSIDGGVINLGDWRGDPVLVVNTASRCGFTHQYNGLQALYDRFRDQGFKLLAVPSNDFRQELATAEEVQAFCDVNFGLDLPMTDITSVRGQDAHPFYARVKAEAGFTPRWNFNKILLDHEGNVVRAWGAMTRPNDPRLVAEIEALLK